MLCRVTLVRTDVSEERIASIIRLTRIGELGTTLGVISNRSTLLTLFLAHRFLSTWWWSRYVPPKRRFLQESRGITSQKKAFFVSCLRPRRDFDVKVALSLRAKSPALSEHSSAAQREENETSSGEWTFTSCKYFRLRDSSHVSQWPTWHLGANFPFV
jgi:hypothetical protein